MTRADRQPHLTPTLRPFVRAARAAGAIAMITLWPSLGWAQDGGGLEPGARTWLLVLGGLLIAILTATTGLLWIAWRRRQRTAIAETQRTTLAHALTESSGITLSKVANMGARSSGLSAIGSGQSATSTLDDGGAAAFFETEVSPEAEQALRHRSTDYLDTSIVVRGCPECDRVYDISAEYCPHDGQHLQQIEDWSGHEDPEDVDMICPECETPYEPGHHWCSEDHARLTPADPQSHAYITVSGSICPCCHREYRGGLQYCPHDKMPLLPVMGRRTCGAPIQGVGDKTRVCPECGTAYTHQMKYCAFDGTELVNKN